MQDPELILRWVAARAPRPHLILYAGDDIRRFHPDKETNYFERLAQHAEFGLCAVAGNDDGASVRRLIRGTKVYEVHSTPVEIAGWVVLGLEGTESPSMGPLQHTAGEITEHLRKALAWARGRPTIVLSHSPPKGCADRAMRFGLDHIGSTDHFKRFNDQHGHDIGDQVLRLVGSCLGKVTGGGRAFRYGGEEFAIVFPAKDRDHAYGHLEVLRKTIEETDFTVRRLVRRRRQSEATKRKKKKTTKKATTKKPTVKLSLTVSIGVAERNEKNPTDEAVVKAADQALFRAKKKGRNRVAR